MLRLKPFFDTALVALLTGIFWAAPASAAVVGALASSQVSIDWGKLSISGGMEPSPILTAVNADKMVTDNFTTARDWVTPISESFQEPDIDPMPDASADANALSASLTTESSARFGTARADAIRAGELQFSADGQASVSIEYQLDAFLGMGGEEALAWAFITLEFENGTELRDDAIIDLVDPGTSDFGGTLQLSFNVQAGDLATLTVNAISDSIVAPVPIPGALILLVSALVPIYSWRRVRPS